MNLFATVDEARDLIRRVAREVERANPAAHQDCMVLMDACDDLKDAIARPPGYEARDSYDAQEDAMWERAELLLRGRERGGNL